jgi:hypothetical protein
VLTKFSVLKSGISEKFIPLLSATCKKEIEGSFKITKDEKLREAALADAGAVEKDDRDQLLEKLIDGTADDVKKLPEMLQAKSDDDEEGQDPDIEDLVRQVFAAMVHF